MLSIVKTAGSFDKVLASCNTLGTRYQPATASLSITALSEMSDRAKESMEAVNTALTAYTLAANERRKHLALLPSLAIRVVRMLKASGIPPALLEDAIALKQKLTRNGMNKTSGEGVPEGVPVKRGPVRKHMLARIEHFSQFVDLVASIDAYSPNEAELKIESLRLHLAAVKDAVQVSNEAKITLDSLKEERKQLFAGNDGLYARILAVKDYFRAAFGFTSSEFALICKQC